jgi:hypothetical protein
MSMRSPAISAVLLGYEEKGGIVQGWLRDARAQAEAEGRARGLTARALERYIRETSHDMLRPRLLEELRDGRHTGRIEDTVQDYLNRLMPYHMEVARKWGLDVVAYEGGSHVVGVGDYMWDEDLAALFIDVNYSEGMADLYTEMLTGWVRGGGGMFAHFSDIRVPLVWGSFGALRHLTDHNPRWDALVSFDPTKVQK